MTVRNSALAHISNFIDDFETDVAINLQHRNPLLRVGGKFLASYYSIYKVLGAPVTLTIDIGNGIFRRYQNTTQYQRNNLTNPILSIFQHITFIGGTGLLGALVFKVTLFVSSFFAPVIAPNIAVAAVILTIPTVIKASSEIVKRLYGRASTNSSIKIMELRPSQPPPPPPPVEPAEKTTPLTAEEKLIKRATTDILSAINSLVKKNEKEDYFDTDDIWYGNYFTKFIIFQMILDDRRDSIMAMINKNQINAGNTQEEIDEFMAQVLHDINHIQSSEELRNNIIKNIKTVDDKDVLPEDYKVFMAIYTNTQQNQIFNIALKQAVNDYNSDKPKNQKLS